jgi:Flp pilus assembly protein TadD
MTSFRLAESALQRGDVAQAERLAAKAAKGDPERGEYVALYTWIKTMGMHTDAATLEAIAVLTEIIDDEPSERALLYRGKLQKRMKRMREALRDFERVLEINPKHREAASEVRLLKQSRAR